MKNILFTFIFLCNLSLAQEFQILNKVNNEPVSFAHIDFLNGKKTFADQKGIFKIIDKEIDTIKITAIGFKTLRINVDDFKGKLKILMEEDITSLEEVLIKNKKNKILKHKKGFNSINIVLRDFTYNELVVTYIPFPKWINKDVKIKSIIVNTTGLRSKKRRYYPFKVNLYSVNKKRSHPKITDSLIAGIITSRKKGTSHLVKINVEDYDLLIPIEGIFVAFETLSKEFYPKDTLYRTEKRMTLQPVNDFNEYAAAVKTIKANPNSTDSYSFTLITQKFKNFKGENIVRKYWKKDDGYIYDLTIEIEY